MERDLTNCPGSDISAYIDGELGPERELEVEYHLAGCAECRSELSLQRQLLCELDASMLDRDIEMPADFTRVVVTRAESSVGGIRRARERFDFIFICVAILIFVLFASGIQPATLIDTAARLGESVLAVGSFLGRFLYSVSIGLVIVLRSIGSAAADTLPYGAAIAGFAGLFFFISRRVLSFRRV